MSMNLMARAMNIKVGNPLRKLVLIKLADNANDQGECWPSVPYIADQCEISERSVQNHIQELVKSGLVRIEERKSDNGLNRSNVYHLRLNSAGANAAPYGESPAPSGANGAPVSGANAAPRTSHSFEPVIDPSTPLTPQGETENILADAERALAHYNQLTHTRCEDSSPFETLLTATKSRKAYALADLQLVTHWVVSTWKPRNGKYAKPANICRVNRFDGYLADARAWSDSEGRIDCDAVVAAYNRVFSDVLPPTEIDQDRKRAICELLQYLKTQDLDAFQSYFEAFREQASAFYFGGDDGTHWRANFDYLMKPDVLRKTRDGAL
ncbi:helix-turn-helix domain-containing protein [Yersinia sp. Marseille-Q3913]|uniref:helix-turn-helix domain-containing protein n=1 Tax=Yersinia sp. Marseille-Q3913 TaxID=2830769 RepID=UPI001BB06C89|nr:helix-turn-helix domain-containing protein [Yersinia sp. Marseille-Q3913]MBS0054442.1 helix-turn-helix domain-containing protein [Yersinia sp. Marseille-Q3913]